MSVTEPPVEPVEREWTVLRAEGGGHWQEVGRFMALEDDPRTALNLAADTVSADELAEGVALTAACGWVTATVRETLVPARVFEGL